MRALTVKNPWAMKIWHRYKTVEQRTWKTDYRGDVLITSSAPRIENCICGHALCVVRLADVVPFAREHLIPACFVPSNAQPYVLDRYNPSGFAWILEDLRLIKPFQIKGKLNLWNAEVEDRLEFMPSNLSVDEQEAWIREYVEPLVYKPYTPLLAPRNRRT